MRIKLSEALKIYEKYGAEDVPIIFLSDIYVNTGGNVLQISQGMKFDESQYELLVDSNILEIDVIYSERLLAKLISNFPDRYRPPHGRLSFFEMDKLINNIEDINRMSRRKRHIISCCELYKKNSSGVYEIILRYGEKLTYQSWNQLKMFINRNSLIDYRINEAGIIVFVILNPGSPDYAKKFMQYTEVVSLLVEHKKEFNFTIAPDFNPETDVITVNNASSLLDTYLSSKAKLIIVADELTDEYKIALAKVKKFDKYARMMVIKKPDPSQKLQILQTIKKAYNRNPWEEE